MVSEPGYVEALTQLVWWKARKMATSAGPEGQGVEPPTQESGVMIIAASASESIRSL
jgi:hypothetical protein